MTFWMAVILLAAATYTTRSVFVVALADRELPTLMTTALRYVAPAALAAFVATLLVGDQGARGLAPSPELLALVVSALAQWRWRNTTLTMAVGMCALWLSIAAT